MAAASPRRECGDGQQHPDHWPGGAFYIVDPLARLLKYFVFALVAVVFVLVFAQSDVPGRVGFESGEFLVLSLFSLLGILVMISAGSFLVMYLGLESLSLSMYAMVALERDYPVGA